MNLKTKPPIVVFGASGHAKVVIDIIEKESKYRIVGIFDPKFEKGMTFLGYPILGSENDLPGVIQNFPEIFGVVAIGDNWLRKKVVEKVQSVNCSLSFISCVHPSASIGKEVVVGKGTMVMPGVVINAGTTIGDFSILNSISSIDHDCNIGNYVSIAPGVIIGGNVLIGDSAIISLGAKVIHGRKIGKHALVGAGAVVLKDIEDYTVAYGIPAKKIRERKEGDQYL